MLLYFNTSSESIKSQNLNSPSVWAYLQYQSVVTVFFKKSDTNTWIGGSFERRDAPLLVSVSSLIPAFLQVLTCPMYPRFFFLYECSRHILNATLAEKMTWRPNQLAVYRSQYGCYILAWRFWSWYSVNVKKKTVSPWQCFH